MTSIATTTWLLTLLLAGGQGTSPALEFTTLVSTVPSAATVAASSGPVDRSTAGRDAAPLREFNLAWTAYAGTADQLVRPSAATALNVFRLDAQRAVSGVLPIERNPELSANSLVVVGVNATSQSLFWLIVPDTRVIRGEFPGPDGVLRGEARHRVETDLHVTVPDAPDLVGIQMYEPRWTGTTWLLDRLGDVDVRGAR